MCGQYLLGIPGRRSHMGRPNRQAAGDILKEGFVKSISRASVAR